MLNTGCWLLSTNHCNCQQPVASVQQPVKRTIRPYYWKLNIGCWLLNTNHCSGQQPAASVQLPVGCCISSCPVEPAAEPFRVLDHSSVLASGRKPEGRRKADGAPERGQSQSSAEAIHGKARSKARPAAWRQSRLRDFDRAPPWFPWSGVRGCPPGEPRITFFGIISACMQHFRT